MTGGMVQVPGTWCGPGTTPMIAQSPVDSPGMPGQWVEPRPCRRPEPHVRADRRPGALVASPDLPTRGRRGVGGLRARLACLPEARPGLLVLVAALGAPCRLAHARAADLRSLPCHPGHPREPAGRSPAPIATAGEPCLGAADEAPTPHVAGAAPPPRHRPGRSVRLAGCFGSIRTAQKSH